MIQSFADRGTEDLFLGKASKQARKACPANLVSVAQRKLDMLNQAQVLDDMRVPPANRLEKLRGDRSGQWSIRINDQYRICFLWTSEGPAGVEVVHYH